MYIDANQINIFLIYDVLLGLTKYMPDGFLVSLVLCILLTGQQSISVFLDSLNK